MPGVRLTPKVVVSKPRTKKIKVESGQKVIKQEVVYDGSNPNLGDIDGGTF